MKENSTPQPPAALNGHHANGHVSSDHSGNGHAAPGRERADHATLHDLTLDNELTHEKLAARQAAQPHAFPLANLGAAGENDPLPPSLDEDGQPKTRSIVFFSPAPPSERTVGETARRRVIARLEEHFPIRAAELEADLDDGVQAARERHLDLERQLWEQLAHENAETERHNRALEVRRAELEAERDAAVRDDEARLLELDGEHAEAMTAATLAVSRAHGVLDPARFDIVAVRDSMKATLAALAGKLGLPFVPEDERWGEDTARWTDPGSGALFGTSLGLLAGLFEASALKTLQAQTLVMWLVMMLFGVFITLEAARALSGDMARLTEARWMGHSWQTCWPTLLKIVVETLLIVGIWTVVDGNGIMKLVALHETNNGQSSHGTARTLLVLAAGAAVSVPFVAFALARGAHQGRLNAVRLLLQAAQEDDLRERPQVALAVEAVGRVGEIERRQSEVQERLAQTRAPFDAEITRLAAQVKAPRTRLHEDDLLRLRVARDEWAEAFATWKTGQARLTDELEPLNQTTPDVTRTAGPTRREATRPGLLSRWGNVLKRWLGR